ncbi:MAG: magnesium transporter [Lachnospiraceae bacterium]|nr:magnesium transporter [Lachnospiraceae bacterium]
MNTKITLTNEAAVCTQHPDYRTEIAEVIRSNLTPGRMKAKLLDYHENDIAAAMELLKKNERSRLYSILDPLTLAGILEYSDKRKEYLEELGIKKRMEVLSFLEIPTVAEYFDQLDKSERTMLLDLMDEDVRKELMLLTSFDEDEIGSRMVTNYIAVRSGINVRQAMRELIDQAAENDNISTIYVVDENETLIGAIDLKDLIIARENTDLEAITVTSYPYVYAEEEIEDCIERIRSYSEDSIPVLDSDNRLKGVLTAQDITDLIDDEMGDDYAKLAGLTAEEDLQEPLKKSIGKRLPWLVVLFGLGMVVSTVVGLFEHVVAHLALIVCFQSLVLDMAGNVGTQSLAVTIRVLMDEQIGGRQKLAFVGKEARVGLINGMILGALSFLFVGLYLVALKGQSLLMAFSVSFCTGAALLVSMLLSSIAGTVIPIFFKKLDIDPAVASGPLITTVNDLVAVMTYYGLAWILLIHMLKL